MRHTPPDLSWKNKEQITLWTSQMDEWHRQNPKVFMQDNTVRFGLLIFSFAIFLTVAMSWNGIKISPMGEIVGAIFGYFGHLGKEDAQKKWESKRAIFAKNLQDFIRTNKVTSIKIKLLDFPNN